MKKSKIWIVLGTIGIICWIFNQAITFPSQGFGDSTGAPNKAEVFTQYTSCRSASCHGGRALNSSLGQADILSDIPTDGWEPNKVYTIKSKIKFPNKDVYGFQLMAWGDKDSASVGKFIKTLEDSAVVRTSILRTLVGKVIDTNEYATHNSKNIFKPSSVNEKEWTIRWKAPSNKDQNVRFYATFLAANGNGSSTGDYVFTVMKDANLSSLPLSIEEERFNDISATLFPSHSTDIVTVEYNLPVLSNSEIGLYNQKGILIKKIEVASRQGKTSRILEVNELESGLYHVQISSRDFIKNLKFIKY